MSETPPLLIALPHGLNVSGVTMWAVRLANAIVHKGGVGLVVHREPDGHDRLPLEIDPGVMVFDARHLPSIEEAGGDFEPFLGLYRDAMREMATRFGGPVILSPNLHGDYYGIAARLSQTEDIRVVAWQHSDIEYNTRLFVHYEKVISRFIAVSEHIAGTLKLRLGSRAGDVNGIPYGVRVASELPRRDKEPNARVRLIYTGRMDHEQKRVGLLVRLSDELDRRGVQHRLTMVGDGPAAEEIDALVRPRANRMVRLAAETPDRVASLLDENDIFVLSSRYEGLSVSMLEAIARGCVPVVTRVESGASEVIENGVNGLMTRANATNNDTAVVASLADAVEEVISIGIGKMAQRAWETAKEHYSIERHAERVREMIAEIGRSPRRRWPSEKAWAFTTQRAEIGVGSGSVPPDGAQRMKRALDALADRSVVIYGAGEHTRQLAHIIESSPIRLVAIADDDPGKHGTKMLGVPIISPADIAGMGVDDVVVSSWMHEGAMFDAVVQHTGERAARHRLYG